MSEEPVVWTVADGIATIQLNRPKSLNAISPEMRDAIGHYAALVESDPTIRVAILTGTGDRAFCAGADLKLMSAGHVNQLGTDTGGFGAFTRVPRTKPVIAAVNGLAYGGGCELALACELIVAASHASFALPEVRRGIIPGGGGALRLPHRVPRVLAMEMLLTGEPISAEVALEWGLINRVVPGDHLLDCARGLAKQISLGAPMAITAAISVARAMDSMLEGQGWDINDAAVAGVRLTDDAREGPRAFAEKRAPQWSGR